MACFQTKDIKTLSVYKKLYLWAALLWTATVIVLSLISFSKAPKVITELSSYDKIAHFVFYFVFVFLWGNYIFYAKQIQSRTLFLVFFASLIFGGIMEVSQELLTTKRIADRYDMLANFSGAFSGMGVLYFFKKTKKL